MLMPIMDTMMVGHYHTTDLAAVALGNSVYITVFLTLSGVLQALSPHFAHHHGAGDRALIRRDFQQGVWLAALLAVLGVGVLSFPAPLLAWTQASPEVLDKAADYLRAIAFGIPAVMLYKVATALLGATHHQRVLMWVSMTGVAVNVPLNYVLIHGELGLPELGATGCGIATAIATTLNMLLAFRYFARHPDFTALALFKDWQKPDWQRQAELIKLGAPIAFSLMVEISAFTLIALFVARLGPSVIGGHRIAAQMAGLCYMLPLALGTATSILVGQACGAGDYRRARHTAWVGALLAGTLATVVGLIIYLLRNPIAHAFSDDPAVVTIGVQLMIFIAVYQFFDGVQTIGTFALRGYKVTFAPMWIHVLCFWLIGLGGGYYLAFYDLSALGYTLGPSGAAGFWGASVVSTIAAALLLSALLHQVSRDKAREFGDRPL
ncbi:MAG: hypothetical protein RIR70_2033 [Pseudomonadota bacterium]